MQFDEYATPQWALLISFFRWYPDILEDICESPDCEYHNSIMSRVTKRCQARYGTTFTFACRGYGKTTGTVSAACTAGILWPGEVIGYAAPVEKQAAPLASKAFAGYERNYPLLAAHWKRNSDSRESFRLETKYRSRFLMDIDRGMDTGCIIAEECSQEDRNPFPWEEFNQIVLGTNRRQYMVKGQPDPGHVDFREQYITSCGSRSNPAYALCLRIRREMARGERVAAMWIPWQVVVLCRMKPLSYYERLHRRLTPEQFSRECGSVCTCPGGVIPGTAEPDGEPEAWQEEMWRMGPDGPEGPIRPVRPELFPVQPAHQRRGRTCLPVRREGSDASQHQTERIWPWGFILSRSDAVWKGE